MGGYWQVAKAKTKWLKNICNVRSVKLEVRFMHFVNELI